jgi:CHAT domain-containing protein/tetratricopeptide (TPR) repeat protein
MSWFNIFRRRKHSQVSLQATSQPTQSAPTTTDSLSPTQSAPSITDSPPPTDESEQSSNQTIQIDEQLASKLNQLAPIFLEWLNSPTYREERTFLLNHTELLQPECDHLFDVLYQQYTDNPAAVVSLYQHRALLREIRDKDGATNAIDEAYVNYHGGLILPLPPWLESLVNHIDEMEGQGQPNQSAAERVLLWNEALTRISQEDPAPEILAEILARRWAALYYIPNVDPDTIQQTGVALQNILAVYTPERYPLQWAVTMSNLGTLISERIHNNRADNIEQAINCYTNALQVLTIEITPTQWALTQNSLGNAYHDRIQGDRADNIEKAIGFINNALQVYTLESHPLQWANAQNNLGVAYGDRILGDRGENIEKSMMCYSAALQAFTMEDTPVQWAMVVNNLGIAYKNRVLGDESESLEAAIACYTNALQIRTRERFPSDWAVTQNNLGRAYADRIQGNAADNIEQAIACFNAALEIRTRAAAPNQWALTTNNLGNAYLKRLRDDKAVNVEKAITCFNDALLVYTREDYSNDWANTQDYLGTAYAARIKGNRADNLEQALIHFQAALEIHTRDTLPLDWSRTTANLGNTYAARIRGDKGENIEKAIAYSMNAMEVRTRDMLPADWAKLQNDLGNAYLERIQGDRADNLEQAINHYQAALEIFTRTSSPTDWAMAQNNLSTAYSRRIRGDRAENLERAIAAITAAFEVYTRETFPIDWAASQYNLGNYSEDRIQGNRADNVEFAIECYNKALQVLTREDSPIKWAMTQIGQGNAYRSRIRGNSADNIETSIDCYMNALQIYTRDGFPADWALAQHLLGNAYSDRFRGDRAQNIEQAIECYNDAIQIRTREATPIDWAATQINLGSVYGDRIRGDRAENLERSIAYYNAALQIYTREALPLKWAIAQNNLGNAYISRLSDDHAENLERAIGCYIATLDVYTRESMPHDWARIQNNLGNVLCERMRGDREQNIEQAIECCKGALEIYTRESFPMDWALAQSNLGHAFRLRVIGDLTTNLDAAKECYTNALQVYTREDMPHKWAGVHFSLGNIYRDYTTGDREANLKLSVGHYISALTVYTRDAEPAEYRKISIHLAEVQGELGNWQDVHECYSQARDAERLLMALSAGARRRDAILQEGRDANVRDAFALAQLEQLEAAVITVEQSRARTLAEARALDSADPNRISDPDRRARYLECRQKLADAQSGINRPLPEGASEEERRQIDLDRSTAFHIASDQFDTIIAEIHNAQDPAGFLDDEITIDTIWRALEPLTPAHALVYIIATPWGGKALAAFKGSSSTNHCAALDLPDLTSEFVYDLIQIELKDRTRRIVGGFGHAQEGRGFGFVSHIWPGATFAEKIANIEAACKATEQESTLVSAAREIMSYPGIAAHTTIPLTDAEYYQIDPTFSFVYLQHELRRCLPLLASHALQPLTSWLSDTGATGVTIVPCGSLAAFPLLAAISAGENTFAETIPASLVPSARSLIHNVLSPIPRDGVYTLGDPWPTHQKLDWGEAEALSIARLGGNLTRVATHHEATRDWLLSALRQAQIVDACCHGEFNPTDFLQSRLLLANNENLTLGDMLNTDTTSLQGLRLLILSACQTAILDLRGALDEVRSLATGMLQGGAQAVLSALWSVDDRATYLLMLRFAQEWFPNLDREPPAAALARAQHWLRTVTYRELRAWSLPTALIPTTPEKTPANSIRGSRYASAEAVERVTASAEFEDDDTRPYTDPIFWSAFQLTGW